MCFSSTNESFWDPGNFRYPWCPKTRMLTVHNILKSLPWVWIGGLHLLYISCDFIDLCHSPLSYLLSSWRHLVWINSSLPDSHCLIFFITIANDATSIMHHYIFLVSFLFLPELLVIFACLCFCRSEALSWHCYRTIHYNLEILFLSSIS